MYTNKSFIKICLSSSVVIAAIYLEQKLIIIDTLIIINMLEVNHMNVRCVQNQFCYKSNLSRHMITCSGNYVENFKCSQCEKVMKIFFSLKTTLKENTELRIKYVHVARHLRGVHHYSDIRTFVLFINKHEIGNQSYYFLYEDTLVAISVAMCEFTYFIWISCPFTINTG